MASTYSFGLLILFYVLLVLEFLVPSGGLIGVAAVASAVACLVTAFSHSVFLGTVYSLVIMASTPVVLMLVIKLWPHTPIGRRILNRRPGQADPEPPQKVTESGVAYPDLIGRSGDALTDLLPSGRARIGIDALDVTCLDGPVDAGKAVHVVDISGGRIRVRRGEGFKATPDESSDPNVVDRDSPAASDLSFDMDDFE
ncbi:NfeD family protein [Crateriforma conspicua]|uniref:NfeD-like C-terminal domain-containing protein n=1 Tax=Crateriforma conspicua TaxID=2527996 RepID=A0A5C5XXB8_9PLAN|nr:NfeD family protein [Crateriforma conspicua]TWT68056.1 hypothetical protein Pan14r_02940 [Crateriforma conspicua]